MRAPLPVASRPRPSGRAWRSRSRTGWQAADRTSPWYVRRRPGGVDDPADRQRGEARPPSPGPPPPAAVLMLNSHPELAATLGYVGDAASQDRQLPGITQGGQAGCRRRRHRVAVDLPVARHVTQEQPPVAIRQAAPQLRYVRPDRADHLVPVRRVGGDRSPDLGQKFGQPDRRAELARAGRLRHCGPAARRAAWPGPPGCGAGSSPCLDSA